MNRAGFCKIKKEQTLAKLLSSRAWYGMEWKMEWNGTEISIWNMEDARMEWNGRFQEWNGRQSSILIPRGGVEDTRFEAKDTKKFEAKDSLFEDRHSRGQGQECSRPRPRTKDTSASALQKKKVFTKIFQAISTKKRFPKNFSSAPQNFNNSKNSAVLEPRTGQFSRTWDLEDLRPRGRPRGQGRPRGLHLC